jgi:hypothetical protein
MPTKSDMKLRIEGINHPALLAPAAGRESRNLPHFVCAFSHKPIAGE